MNTTKISGYLVIRTGEGACWLASDGNEYSYRAWQTERKLVIVSSGLPETKRMWCVTSGLFLDGSAHTGWEIEQAIGAVSGKPVWS